MQSIEQRYYRETEEHNYRGCKLLVKKDDMLDSLDGKERSYDNSTNGFNFTIRKVQSAVYILYPVCSLLSSFCTNRYPWHQYSLFLVTFIRKTHIIYHKIPVSEVIRHFRSFPH